MDRFIAVNLLISVYCCFIMLINKFWGKWFSPKTGYCIYISVILMLAMPLVPDFTPVIIQDIPVHTNETGFDKAVTSINIGQIKDLYISVFSYKWLIYIWCTGVAVEIFYIFAGMLVIRHSLAKAQSYIDPVFEQCCKTTGIKAELYVSEKAEYPFSVGIFERKVVMPYYCVRAEDVERRHIFLHELIHHKHRDVLLNYIICILNAVYWFNPVVRLSLRNLRLAMEIYCDDGAVGYDDDYLGYGNTILKFAAKGGRSFLVNSISGSKRDIRSRIISLSRQGSNFSSEAGRKAVALIVTIALVTTFGINCFGYSIDDSYRADKNKIDPVDLSDCFNGIEGCFVLYDVGEDKYIVYNEELACKRSSPYSTYKPFIALNALENNIILPDKNSLPWDGQEYYFKEWNRDQNLDTAMENSVNWYFSELDNKLGRTMVISFLKDINYGNCRLKGSMDSYWLEGSLKVSSMEQAKAYAQLYTNEFNCKRENIGAVLSSIKLGDGYYGKTGTGQVDGKTVRGWFNGVYESKGKVYGFSCRIDAKDGADGPMAAAIARKILSKDFS